MNIETEYLVVGKITTAFGIKGWVKIYSFTEEAEDIFGYKPWYLKLKSGYQEVTVQQWKRQAKGLVAKLPDCEDRDSALDLRQVQIAVKSDQFEALQDGDYYWRDLVGCRVVNKSQQDLGIVTELMETGANDVLVVKIDDGAVSLKSAKGELAKERLIPYVPDVVVTDVDIKHKLISVDWPSDF